MAYKKKPFIYKSTGKKLDINSLKESLRKCNKEELIDYAKSLALIAKSKANYNKNEKLLYCVFELKKRKITYLI